MLVVNVVVEGLGHKTSVHKVEDASKKYLTRNFSKKTKP